MKIDSKVQISVDQTVEEIQLKNDIFCLHICFGSGFALYNKLKHITFCKALLSFFMLPLRVAILLCKWQCSFQFPKALPEK